MLELLLLCFWLQEVDYNVVELDDITIEILELWEEIDVLLNK